MLGKQEKGVTLIALIITIIVLLILAGVAFSSLLGSNGLLNRADESAERSRRAAENDELALQELENEIAKWENGSSGGGSKIPQGWEEYVDDVTADGVPIPKGFEYVEGDKNTGTVIKDGDNNQFVWVPVLDLTADGTIDGTNYNKKFGRRKFGMTQTLGGETPVANAFTEVLPPELITSVDKYGGFYIARYQASYASGTDETNYKPFSKVSIEAAREDPFGLWAGVLWNHAFPNIAKAACKNMYGADSSVVSHLPYGAEYDTTLQWLKETVFDGSNAPIGIDSKDWGNYNNSTFAGSGGGNVIDTGSTENTSKNKIYDLAGNTYESTQEVYGTDLAYTFRGGFCSLYTDTGNYRPVAMREYSGSHNLPIGCLGFRPALYIRFTEL